MPFGFILPQKILKLFAVPIFCTCVRVCVHVVFFFFFSLYQLQTSCWLPGRDLVRLVWCSKMFILFVVSIIVITSTCLFYWHVNYFTFSHHFASDVSFGIIKHLLTRYSGNSKFIDPSIGISGSINLLFPSYPVNKYKLSDE